MTPKLDKWTIVLAGHWNRMIFTPQWVGNHLFPGVGELETMVSLLPVLPLIYRDPAVTVEVAQSRIVFKPRAPTDTLLQRAERMARTVLEELDDTPLVAVGVNFGFREPNPPNDVLNIFASPDSAELAIQGWEVQERQITRKLFQEGTLLNLTLKYGPDGVDCDFNFHTETTENETARHAVTDRVIGLKNAALELLDKTYHLQPGPEGNDDE